MKVRVFAALLSAALVFCATACDEGYNKYQVEFSEFFDAYITLSGYTKTEEEFLRYAAVFYDRVEELDALFDIYTEYPGLNNLWAVNKNAGVEPLKVKNELLSLLEFSRDFYAISEGTVNIALGPVLSVWRDYRNDGIENPENAALPPMKELIEANAYTDINKLIIDRENSAVFLSKKGMSLDVGSVAKGYAAQLVAEELLEAGFSSFVIDMGGNVVTSGKPLDGKRGYWSVGVQNPDLNDAENDVIKILELNDASVVTSGAYRRYYTVDGRRYCHIVDPLTLMPADAYESVTVIGSSSAYCDPLSTALFILPVERGTALAERFGVKVVWVCADGTIIESGEFPPVD